MDGWYCVQPAERDRLKRRAERAPGWNDQEASVAYLQTPRQQQQQQQQQRVRVWRPERERERGGGGGGGAGRTAQGTVRLCLTLTAASQLEPWSFETVVNSRHRCHSKDHEKERGRDGRAGEREDGRGLVNDLGYRQ